MTGTAGHLGRNNHLTQSGAFFACLAFVSWGILPVYWKQVEHVSALEILCHRVVWSLLFLALVMSWQRRWGELREIRVYPKTLITVFISGALIGTNWFTFIWGVNNEHIVEVSLGYYLNPLLNVLLGFLFLKERFRPLQLLAIFLASIGVIHMIVQVGRVPIVGLTLATTFALYGFVRKQGGLKPIPGLTVETALLFLPALAYLLYRDQQGVGAFLGQDRGATFFLLGAGVVTSFPLLGFVTAAKKMRLSTLGMFQYLAPTITLLVGTFLYGEPFTTDHTITFGFIWSALFFYSLESMLSLPRLKRS